MDIDWYEEYLTSIYLTKYYYGSVKISKLLFSWYLQINEKSIIPKKIDQREKLVQTPF